MEFVTGHVLVKSTKATPEFCDGVKGASFHVPGKLSRKIAIFVTALVAVSLGTSI